MKFDGTVSLGNLLSMITIVAAVAVGWGKLSGDIASLTSRMTSTEQASAGREVRVRALEVWQAGTAADIRSISAGIADIKAKLDRLTGSR